MTSDARIATGQRWKAFYDEPGGLAEMISHMTIEHTRQAVTCEPWETDKLKKVALSLKLIGELEQTIRRVIDSGKLAEAARVGAEAAANTRDRKPLW